MKTKERPKGMPEEVDATQSFEDVYPRARTACEVKEGGAELERHVGTESRRSRVPRLRRPVDSGVHDVRNEVETIERPESPATDLRLMGAIDAALRKVEEVRLETRSHDEEIARLGEETRRLIDEMMRDLNLKAA